MQRLEASGAVRPLYGKLGVRGLKEYWVISKGKHEPIPTNDFIRQLGVTSRVRVKCTLVRALRLCRGPLTAHRWSKGIFLFFLDHDTRSGLGVSVTPRPLFTPGKDPVPIFQEAGWAPGPVWTGGENLAPHRD